MKTKSITGTLFFVLFFFSAYSQEQVIKLKLEEGHEYVFEAIDKQYNITKDDSINMLLVRNKETRLFVEKFIRSRNAKPAPGARQYASAP